ncbi:MAG: methyltransferase domain-containing protein [Chitinophagales bacterium]|nr:methyltransferase domain-containing protein [Chitinophagales bacterium]
MTKIDNGCCVVVCERPLDAQYWDNQWKSQTTGWDLGMPAPPLVSFIETIENKNARILIPGCGNAYEAEYLISKGFTDITLIDISETASNLLKEKFAKNPQVKVICDDFFKHNENYDVILEQTFFCALPTRMRQRYVWKMHHLLKEYGILAGLLFNRTFEQSPPFGGSREEYEELFHGAFFFEILETASNSIQPRSQTELIFQFKKINVLVNLYLFQGITCNGCKNSVTEIYSKMEGVKNVSMSSDFKEILIVSDHEIDVRILQELVSYDEDYKIDRLPYFKLSTLNLYHER